MSPCPLVPQQPHLQDPVSDVLIMLLVVNALLEMVGPALARGWGTMRKRRSLDDAVAASTTRPHVDSSSVDDVGFEPELLSATPTEDDEICIGTKVPVCHGNAPLLSS